jgi:hypothetical protein
MNHRLDPDTHQPIETVWSDYNGSRIYADFDVDGATATTTKWYEPGIGETDDPFGSPNPVTSHYHGDMIGSMRMMTDEVSAGRAHKSIATMSNHRSAARKDDPTSHPCTYTRNCCTYGSRRIAVVKPGRPPHRQMPKL